MKKVINGVEVEVDEQGNPVAAADDFSGLNLDDPDFDADAEVLKRGSLAVLKENQKKGKELHELKERLKAASAPKPPAAPNAKEPQIIADYKAMLRRKGFTDEEVEMQVKAMGFVSDNITAMRMQPAEKLLYGDVLDKTISAVEQEPEAKLAFAIKKFRAQIKAHIQENYKSQYWSDPVLVRSAVGIIIAENVDKLQSSNDSEPPAEPPVEDTGDKGKPPKKLPGIKFSDEAIAEYAHNHGWDINTQGVRENCVKQMTLRANIEKRNREQA